MKRFPEPRPRTKTDPYRQAAPPAPGAPIDIVKAPVPSKRPLDVFEELDRVEIDPRVLEEARSSNRAWGVAAIVAGILVIAFSLALDLAMYGSSYSGTRYLFIPSLGAILVGYGIRRWRLRGIEY